MSNYYTHHKTAQLEHEQRIQQVARHLQHTEPTTLFSLTWAHWLSAMQHSFGHAVISRGVARRDLHGTHEIWEN